jgi:hypothetical protein
VHATPQHGSGWLFSQLFLQIWGNRSTVRVTWPTFGFFFYHTLDKVVCTHLAAIFRMPIWHPTIGATNEGKVDSLFAAQVDVYLLQLGLSSSVTTSFDNKFAANFEFVYPELFDEIK